MSISQVAVVQNVNISVHPGEVVAIVSKSQSSSTMQLFSLEFSGSDMCAYLFCLGWSKWQWQKYTG